MKHSIITAIALATITTFAACSSDDTTTSAVTEQEQTQPTAITFNTYLGRSTRGTIATADNITSKGGVGVIGMSTTGKKYGNGSIEITSVTGQTETKEDAEANFSINFMPNTALTKPSSGEIWSYNPVRYWPTASTDYLTFLVYAPYADETLYDASGDGEPSSTSGNLTWIKHEVKSTVADQVDLLRSRYNLANMQLLTDGTNVTTKSDESKAFTEVGSEKVVNVDLIHATSRLAVAVTAPFLTDNATAADNFKNGNNTTSNTQITINKIVLLGDNTSATETTPKGIFTKSAYLNLAGGVTYDDNASSNDQWTYTYNNLWKHQSTDELSFSYSDFATGTYKITSHSSDPNNPQLIWTQATSQPTDGTQNIIKATRTVTENSGTYTYSDYKSNAVGTKASDYLFLIPQKFTSSTPLYVYIDYTIKYADVTGSAVNYTAYGKIGDSTDGQEFKAGHAYVLNIEIDGTNGPKLTPIKFTVSLEPWPDEEGVNVTY